MSAKEPVADPTPESIARYVKKNAAQVKAAQHAHHGGGETVREAEYKGHRIIVRTTYQVEVDGVPITGHMGVTSDGQVHYHAVPNIAFASAMDLLKALIDIFPDEFGEGSSGPDDHGGGDHGGHHPPAGPSRQPAAARKRRVKKGKVK